MEKENDEQASSTEIKINEIVTLAIKVLNEQEDDVDRMYDDVDHIQDVVVDVMADMGMDLSTEEQENIRDQANESIAICRQKYFRSDEETLEEKALKFAHDVEEILGRAHRHQFCNNHGWLEHLEIDSERCGQCALLARARAIIAEERGKK